MSLFDDVKGNLVEWYTVTSEKTSEVARVSARKYDKFGISRDIERQFGELGSLVYNGLKEGREGILDDEAVKHLYGRLTELEEDLRAKDSEIDDIKREYSDRKGENAAAGMSATVITDPILDSGNSESAIIIEPEVEDSEEDDPHAAM